MSLLGECFTLSNKCLLKVRLEGVSKGIHFTRDPRALNLSANGPRDSEISTMFLSSEASVG